MQLRCPRCGEGIVAEDVNVATSIAKCRACNEVFDFTGQIEPSQAMVPIAPQPATLKIFEDDAPVIEAGYRDAEAPSQKLLIVKRWFTPSVFFLVFFCLFWDGFLVFWYAMAIKNGIWLMMLFPILHLAAGVTITYSTLATLFNSTKILLDGASLRIAIGPLPWRGNRVLDVGLIERLEQESVSRKTEAVHLNAVLKSGASVRLVAKMSPEEARFVEQQIGARIARKLLR
jgi:hypothetical protein